MFEIAAIFSFTRFIFWRTSNFVRRQRFTLNFQR